MPGQGEQGGMKADCVAASLQHSTFEIVIQQDTRNAAPGGEGTEVAAQEALHPGIEVEAQEDLP